MTRALRASLPCLLLVTLCCAAHSAFGQAAAPTPGAAAPAPGSVTITVQLGSPDANRLAELIAAARGGGGGVRATADGAVAFDVPDIESAIALFERLAAGLPEWAREPRATLETPLQHADPRSVRAALGTEALRSDPRVGLSCRLEPPAILLSGPPDSTAALAERARALDKPPPRDPAPDDVVRTYLERWLITAEDSPAPDVAGMYALTTQVARSRIGETEFALVVAETGVSPEGEGPGRRAGEIVAVYPPVLSADGTRAVVDYSIAWVVDRRVPSLAAPDAPAVLRPEDAARAMLGTTSVPLGASASQYAGDYLAWPRDPGLAGSAPVTFAGLHRGRALIVRDLDGAWRLPMLFDDAGRAWLTPLSPSLIPLLAPDLAAEGVAAQAQQAPGRRGPR